MAEVRIRFLKENGICRDEPIGLFYPKYDSPSSTEVAREICSRCPVKPECLEWALKHDEQGVWGGTSEATRRSLTRPRSRTKCIVCDGVNIVPRIEQRKEICVDCGVSWPI